MSHLQRELEFNGRKITLVGTAHVSAESIKEVETTIALRHMAKHK